VRVLRVQLLVLLRLGGGVLHALRALLRLLVLRLRLLLLLVLLLLWQHQGSPSHRMLRPKN
jgi:hypothetical protein